MYGALDFSMGLVGNLRKAAALEGWKISWGFVGISGIREALGRGFGAPIFREDLSFSEFFVGL